MCPCAFAALGLLALACAPTVQVGRSRDLLLAFPSAVHSAPDLPAGLTTADVVRVALMRCEGVQRTGILLCPPSSVSFETKVLPGSTFVADVGIDDDAETRSGRVTFFVEVRDGDREERLESVAVRPEERHWHPVRVDLSRYAGRRVTLVLRTDGPVRASASGFATPRIASAGQPVRLAPFSDRSVVLISLDTVRVDRLGSFGSPAGLTPHIDRFLRTCRTYPEAVAPANWTLPSHMTLLSGTHADVHRVKEGSALPLGIPTLAEALAAKGYATAGFVGDVGWLKPEFGFGRGFSVYMPTAEPSRLRTWRVRDHIESLAGRNVLLFVHLFDAHSDTGHLPYEASPEILDLDAPGWRAFPGCDGATCGTALLIARSDRGARLSADMEQEVERLYGAGVHELDGEVAHLFSELRAVGLLDRALVVLFSDHGEEFWDHGKLLHGQAYVETTRALLALRLPGRNVGALADGLPTLVDVAPTVFAFARAGPRPGAWQGVDLLTTVPRVAYSVAGTGHSILRSRRATIFRGPRGFAWAFDRDGDPGETRPLPPDFDRELRDRLDEIRADNAKRADLIGKGDALTMPEDEVERLRALGYLR